MVVKVRENSEAVNVVTAGRMSTPPTLDRAPSSQLMAVASLARLSIGSNTALGFPIPLNVTGYAIRDLTDGATSGTQGSYVAAVDNALMTATTGDVRGTVVFNTAPNGVHAYEVVMMCPDPAYLALPQYAG